MIEKSWQRACAAADASARAGSRSDGVSAAVASARAWSTEAPAPLRDQPPATGSEVSASHPHTVRQDAPVASAWAHAGRGAGAFSAACIPFGALTPAQLTRWEFLRESDDRFDSPFFAPELVAAVAAERRGIEVVVVERSGAPIAFIPFRRASLGIALPAFGPFGDFDGPIAARSAQLDLRTALRACGLGCWIFQHAPAEDDRLTPFLATAAASPFIDTSGGFDAYLAKRTALGGRELKGALRKARRAEREIGPLQLEPRVRDAEAFDLLVAWKRAQIRERGLPDPIAAAWTHAFLRRVAALRSDGCAGMLSGLRIGGRLAALSLGVRSRQVLHGWITIYEPSLARHSPGVLLLVELVRAAQSLGIARIDMGPGREAYKWRFHTGARALAGGAIAASPVLQRTVHAGLRARDWLRNSPRGEQIRALFSRAHPGGARDGGPESRLSSTPEE